MPSLNRMGLSRVGGIVGSYAPVAASTLLTSLVASWKLDDLTDATGRGNTLTNNNSVSFNTGKIGNAGYFATASSRFLSLASNADVQMGNNPFTIGCWVYLASKTSRMMIVTKDSDVGGTTNREYHLSYDQGLDRFVFSYFDAGGTGYDSVANTFGSPSTGTWYCVVAGYDQVNGRGFISVNDLLNTGGPGTAHAVGGAGFRIGSRVYSGFEDYFDGRIDNVNIWQKQLSSGEITEFYNAGTGKEYSFS